MPNSNWWHIRKKIRMIVSGQIFGRLTVIRKGIAVFRKNGSKENMWICVCDCNRSLELKPISTNALNNGHTKSCGCLRNSLSSARLKGKPSAGRLKFPTDATWNDYFRVYKKSAKIRKLIFDISLEEFKNICLQKCYYCNNEPFDDRSKYCNKNGSIKERYKTIDIEWIRNGIITVNGVDRYDNNKGYIISNCVPCCTLCNYMKSALDYKQFHDHVNKIKFNISRRDG